MTTVYKLASAEATLEKMQALVGGYIEIVEAICEETDCPGHDLVIDEEGKLKGKEVNPEASRMYWAGTHGNGRGDPIAGDVVLITGGRLD